MGADEETAFLHWLVERRSLNQKQSIRLYDLIVGNEKYLKSLEFLSVTSQMLISMNFSLWRAVFLCDSSEEYHHFDHSVSFLKELIAHNSINYFVDRRNRNWSARYYIAAAQFTLNRLKEDVPQIYKDMTVPISDKDTQGKWDRLHHLTEEAINRLQLFLKPQ